MQNVVVMPASAFHGVLQVHRALAAVQGVAPPPACARKGLLCLVSQGAPSPRPWAAVGRQWARRVQVLGVVVRTLLHAHRIGVTHGDLAPHNIVLRSEGGAMRVLLAGWRGTGSRAEDAGRLARLVQQCAASSAGVSGDTLVAAARLPLLAAATGVEGVAQSPLFDMAFARGVGGGVPAAPPRRAFRRVTLKALKAQ
jgi:hypothetical protein